MTPKQIALSQLTAVDFLFDKFLQDMSDDDCRYQPGDGCNHANWILCHLAVSEDSICAKMGGTEKRLSEDLHKRYAGGSTCTSDDGMTKAEAWKLYNDTRKRTVEFINSFPESRYDEKAPDGFPPIMPTMGSLVALLGMHPYWHFGQLTVNRKLLKKPNLL
jgi:hypothetical protein